MTSEQKAEIVRTAYESYTHEPWIKCGRQEHWENLVDEVNRRPHLTGSDAQEEHVRQTYLKVMAAHQAADKGEIMLGKVTAPIKVDVSEAKPKPKK
jgi:hypothetical protein